MTRTPDRTGPQGWHAKWPLSKVAVVPIAFVLGIGIFTYQECFIWTPLQRWYFNEYSFSHHFPTTRGNYWLLMKTDRNGHHSVAGNSDVVFDFRGRNYRFPFELSDQARQQGAVQLNLETVHYNNAEMERILRGEIFAGRSVGEMIFPSCAASFGFLVIGLAFAIPRDRARRRQRDEGTRLKGPQLVTVEEFNRWSGSDGINFLTTERKRSLSIPRSLESSHIMIMGDTGAGKTFDNPREVVDYFVLQLKDWGPNPVAADFLKRLATKRNSLALAQGLHDGWRREQISAVIQEIFNIGDLSAGGDDDSVIPVRKPRGPKLGGRAAAQSLDDDNPVDRR